MSSTECPVSYVTGESRSLVERFFAEREIGASQDVAARPAREADGFLVMAKEMKLIKEGASGE